MLQIIPIRQIYHVAASRWDRSAIPVVRHRRLCNGGVLYWQHISSPAANNILTCPLDTSTLLSIGKQHTALPFEKSSEHDGKYNDNSEVRNGGRFQHFNLIKLIDEGKCPCKPENRYDTIVLTDGVFKKREIPACQNAYCYSNGDILLSVCPWGQAQPDHVLYADHGHAELRRAELSNKWIHIQSYELPVRFRSFEATSHVY